MAMNMDKVWYGSGVIARCSRMLMSPFELVYRQVVERRNSSYDSNGDKVHNAVLPCLSVGNLTVGGTGKTPFSAWCVRRLLEKGAHPAIVMRGYGDDEWKVHARLNPAVHVIVTPDRVAGVATARTRGADCVVLDDAFQHRRVSRVSDIVLISADQFTDHVHLLPRGPYREALSSLKRATAVVITEKNEGSAKSDHVSNVISSLAPNLPQSTIRIVPGDFRLAATLLDSRGASRDKTGLLNRDAGWLSGKQLCVISGIANPQAFEQQLVALGGVVSSSHRFADHYQFSEADAHNLAKVAEGGLTAVCTLKDAVKLAPLWPREAPPLWYVSQKIEIVRGLGVLDAELSRVLGARPTSMSNPT